MSQRLNLTIALAPGLAGGFMCRFLAPRPFQAQSQILAPKEIRAQIFVLVDSRGFPLCKEGCIS